MHEVGGAQLKSLPPTSLLLQNEQRFYQKEQEIIQNSEKYCLIFKNEGANFLDVIY